MKLLLTSGGIGKRSIAGALQDLTGKQPSEVKVAMIPTAANAERGNKDWVVRQFLDLWRFGYNWVDIVDPSAANVDWRARLEDADVVHLSGGNTFHLLDQCRKTGFDTWLTDNLDTKIYVGGSASSIIATPTIEIASLPYGDENLPGLTGLSGFNWVNFEIAPHCDQTSLEAIEAYAKGRRYPVYALDDQSAIKVENGNVEVISEGYWKIFNP